MEPRKLVVSSFLALLLISSKFLLVCCTAEADTNSVNNTKCAEKHEESFNSDVHIAKLEFERVQTLVIVTVFIMVVVLAKLGKCCVVSVNCT